MNGHHFLAQCVSKPETLADLKVGDCFVFFPDDGDDHGHGGFKGGARLFVKIEPFYPGEPYHPDVRNTCREYERPEVINSMPLRYPVIKVHGLASTQETQDEQERQKALRVLDELKANSCRFS